MPGREKTYLVNCTVAADSPYTLYTTPSNCLAKAQLLYVSNSNGSNTVGITLTRNSTDYKILGGRSKTAGDVYELSHSYLALEPGDVIKITIDSDGDVTGIVTVEEEFNTNKV